MEHQTLRGSREDILDIKSINSEISHNNNAISGTKDYLQQFYYTMPNQELPNPSTLGVRLAPLAKFDERDFDLPLTFEAKHKVKLFKALLIFFSTIILVRKSLTINHNAKFPSLPHP